MQYGEPFPQGKSNSSFEVVTFPWINDSGYNFNIMNTLQVTISKLPAKANKIYIEMFI